MSDPLSEIMTLLRPRAVFSKEVSGAGRWAVQYAQFGEPSFCAVLDGRCRLAVAGRPPLTLVPGDFVLLPATPAFTLSGLEPAAPRFIDPRLTPDPPEGVRHGRSEGEAEVRMLGGYFAFDSPDAGLLVSMLPDVVHVSGVARLATLVGMVREETGTRGPGCDLVLERLVEILLIEALRCIGNGHASPGLLRGLGDARVAQSIRRMHAEPARAWSIADLASEASLSRSAYFDRFTRVVGVSPMDYLLGWRMALAKDLLRRQAMTLADVAERVGYGSASTFSTAFSRYVGQSPGRYARGRASTA